METNENVKVKASKSFDVPVEVLYNAWTNPEQLKQWWKPMNNTLTEVINDVKEGGEVSYIFRASGLEISGKYIEVKAQEKLVYTWNWTFTKEVAKNGSYELIVEFKSTDGGSIINITQDNFDDEEGTHPHKEGWEKGLEDLAGYLAGVNDENTHKAVAEMDRSGGYNESPEQVKVAGG